MKKHWKTLLLSAIVILIPALVGLFLWDALPDKLPCHWNGSGEIDGYSSKLFGVLGFPLMMLFFQFIVVFSILADPKNRNISGAMITIFFFMIPVLSLLVAAFVYLSALGVVVRTEKILPIFLGLLFVGLGFCLPKCRQNYSVGIKLPWTLNSEENWNRTHRFGGKVWVIGGFLMMITGFFAGYFVYLPVTVVIALLPTIYSFILYRKGI